jgi:hypothetical protein
MDAGHRRFNDGDLRASLFRSVAAANWAEASAQLGAIRRIVAVNLTLGLIGSDRVERPVLGVGMRFVGPANHDRSTIPWGRPGDIGRQSVRFTSVMGR